MKRDSIDQVLDEVTQERVLAGCGATACRESLEGLNAW